MSALTVPRQTLAEPLAGLHGEMLREQCNGGDKCAAKPFYQRTSGIKT